MPCFLRRMAADQDRLVRMLGPCRSQHRGKYRRTTGGGDSSIASDLIYHQHIIFRQIRNAGSTRNSVVFRQPRIPQKRYPVPRALQ